jgi:ubiquinone/menaquinone biosynthesis C-methylase UbiE
MIPDMFHAKGPTFWELAVQALSSTERGYDLLAPKFDYTPFRTPDAILVKVGEHLQTFGPIAAGLDICCGTGAAMRVLRPLCRDQVVGLDISAGMLAEARRCAADASGAAALHFVRADALRMPFEAAFDLAVCFGAFGHILTRDEPRFVAEVARVLRPGGRFVFVTTHMPPPWSLRYWLARGFNGAMRMRNLLVSPPFIMYYLTFVLPEVQKLLETHGFEVEVRDVNFARPWSPLRLVTATRRAASPFPGVKEPGYGHDSCPRQMDSGTLR